MVSEDKVICSECGGTGMSTTSFDIQDCPSCSEVQETSSLDQLLRADFGNHLFNQYLGGKNE